MGISKPKAWEAKNNAWISEEMYRLVGTRVSTLQDPACDKALIWRLSLRISQSLKSDRWHRAEEVGIKIESLLTSVPPPLKVSMAPDESLVQGCSRPLASDRLSNL